MLLLCDLAFNVFHSCSRNAIEQLCMFKQIERRPMAWPCQLTVGSCLSIGIVGYKAVSLLRSTLDQHTLNNITLNIKCCSFSITAAACSCSLIWSIPDPLWQKQINLSCNKISKSQLFHSLYMQMKVHLHCIVKLYPSII